MGTAAGIRPSRGFDRYVMPTVANTKYTASHIGRANAPSARLWWRGQRKHERPSRRRV